MLQVSYQEIYSDSTRNITVEVQHFIDFHQFVEELFKLKPDLLQVELLNVEKGS